jgi:hypothetical protein
MKEVLGTNHLLNNMWDIVLINITDNDKYIVMTQNGDYHCIDRETFERFEKNGRVIYEPETIKK